MCGVTKWIHAFDDVSMISTVVEPMCRELSDAFTSLAKNPTKLDIPETNFGEVIVASRDGDAAEKSR